MTTVSVADMPSGSSARGVPGARAWAWILVAAFFFVLNGMELLYWTAELEVPGGLHLVLRALALIVFWRLLETECAPYRVTFPFDAGFFLFASSFLLLPYYLWRTQRWRGVAKVFAIVSLWLGTYLLCQAAAWFLATE